MVPLRKGRFVKHSSRVDLSTLESVEPNAEHRQMIKFSYLGRSTGGKATIIMMNPSSAGISMADVTIRRVEDVTFQIFEQISEVRIFNLFTVRGVNPADLNKLYCDKGMEALLYPNTDKILKKSIRSSDVAIAAWGGPCGIIKTIHSKRVAQVKKLLRSASIVYRIAGSRYSPQAAYPLHGRLWGYKMRAYPYNCL